MLTRNFLLLLLLFFFRQSGAQNCTNLGQNPGTAFPVCGSSSFVQTTVPVCGQRLVPTPCLTNGSIFMDKNPYWYKFTCFTAGTLGFLITPKNLRDDYDWQLFDVTNHAPSDIYNDASLFVACNWSGETGKTGASAVGTSLQNCEGGGVPLFSKMPMLQKGHNYLLLVSHFDDLSQSGYSLDFNGGTAVITDTTPGKMLQARSFCDGKRISITFNKNLKCSSLSADGSDFSMSGTSVQISEAISTSCSNGFDLDSVILTLNAPLPPGIYTVAIKKGSDSNTLLDNCDTPIAEGDSMTFSVFSAQPAAIDSIVQPGCAPDELQLVINGSVRCNSVAADGSDFALAGVPGTVIRGASTVCSGDVTTIIKLQLSKPIYASGTSTVTLQKGSDGNTIVNECGLETAAGASVSFATADTVSAAFDYVINYGCKGDVVSFTNNGNIGVPRWRWQFNNRDTSGQQNPVYTYKTFGAQTVQLLVSNGTCSDSASASFTLDNELKAVFTGTGQICPNDLATFTDTSIGKISQWYWDFGNGNTSTERNPQPQAYPLVPANQNIFVTLVVKDNFNCSDTAYKPIKVLYNCYIGVPTAFTPNGDNLNDYLYPVNAWKAKNLLFKVFNRFGQVVFQTEDFTKKWDGTINGVKQNTGTYAWTLQYVDTDTGRPYHLKGTTVLIR